MANISNIKDRLDKIVLDLISHDTEEEWFEYSISEKLNGEGHSCGHGGCHH